MSQSDSSTKQLRQVLGFGDLLSTAIGQIIGAGIMTLLGSAIGLTGRSVPFALIISAFLVIGYTLPMIIIPGTVRVRGGQYTLVGMLAGKKLTGVFIIIYIMSNIAMAMYAVSFAGYFIDFFGVGDPKVVAVGLLTIFFIINIVGVDVMAKFQNVIVVLLCLALASLGVFGVGRVQPDYLTNGFLTNGVLGLFKAGGLMTWALGGSYVLVNLSAEAKNPTRDIPLAMIISTVIVAAIYALVAVVASGVFPVEQVANQNLSIVAKEVLSTPVYSFFMVCGAMFALVSTLNAQYAWATKPILQACDDGWLPKKLAYLHPKFKTPVILLAILYVLGVVCVLTGWDVSILGNLALISSMIAFLLVSVFMGKLPEIAPEAWKKSKFHMNKGMLTLMVVYSSLASVFVIWLNAIQLSMPFIIGNIVIIVLAFVFSGVREKYVNMDISYEDN